MQTRRQFLQTAAAAVALGALKPSAHAADEALSLGFSLYGMKTLPIDQALQTCAEIGYRNVELALNPGFPTEPKLLSAEDRKKLRQNLASQRLNCSALMVNISLAADDKTHAQNLEVLKAAAQLAHDVAPDQPPVVETVLGGKPTEWDSIKDRMVERLRGWAAVAEAGKITLAVKAHINNAVDSPEKLLWLLQKAGSESIKVAYDYSHFGVQGIGLEESMRALVPHTRFVHLKDAVMEGKKVRFVLPGEGPTDFGRYLKLLKELGYRGPAVVEVSAQVFNKPGYDPIAAAKKCYAVLSAALPK